MREQKHGRRGAFPFAGKAAVITGAGSGIGLALAHACADEGMRLVLADRDAARLEAVAAELRAKGAEVTTRLTDVARAEEVEALAVAAEQLYGGTDLLFNNAGVTTPDRWRNVWEFTPADWQKMFDVNVLGVAYGLTSFVPRMIARGRPAHVVNMASLAGLLSGSGSVPYGASKHAVVRITEGLAAGLAEQGHPIGVTLVCPGLVRTRIFDDSGAQPDLDESGRFRFTAATAEPDDLAREIVQAVAEDRYWLVSDQGFEAAVEERLETIRLRRRPGFAATRAAQQRD